MLELIKNLATLAIERRNIRVGYSGGAWRYTLSWYGKGKHATRSVLIEGGYSKLEALKAGALAIRRAKQFPTQYRLNERIILNGGKS